MNIKLYKEPNENYPTLVQLLFNRGIPLEEIPKYINTTIDDVTGAEMLGEDILREAVATIVSTIQNNGSTVVLVDSDCDGITSSAILINYLHRIFPAYVENHLDYIFHESKGHGLADTINEVIDYDLVILPDSGTNDVEYHRMIRDKGGKVIVLDHHEQDEVSDAAIIINNQCSNYSNKNFSGAGIVWLFCKYIDKLLGEDYADNYLDLMATGLMGDMMALTSAETRAAIFEGFKKDNIRNPFIYTTVEKNEFSFNKSDYQSSHLEISPIGAAFFLIPQINALCRSGTMEEKEIIFKAFLDFKAFDYVLSNKRGHKLGEQEQIVTQAVRMITNIKNHQDKQVLDDMEMLERMIGADDGVTQHKAWVFCLNPGQISPNVAGLVANKIMNKYQHCTCVLLYDEESNSYRGSARGYAGSGLESFRDVCLKARGVNYASGHSHAFGLSIDADQIEEFLEDTDAELATLPDEASYFVDYIWTEDSIDGARILDIADLNDFIGTGLPRSYVYIKDVMVTENNTFWMKDKHLKINTPSHIDIIIWDCAEQINELMNKKINLVCKCNKNEWGGNISPQLIAEAWEVNKEAELSSIERWGF